MYLFISSYKEILWMLNIYSSRNICTLFSLEQCKINYFDVHTTKYLIYTSFPVLYIQISLYPCHMWIRQENTRVLRTGWIKLNRSQSSIIERSMCATIFWIFDNPLGNMTRIQMQSSHKIKKNPLECKNLIKEVTNKCHF